MDGVFAGQAGVIKQELRLRAIPAAACCMCCVNRARVKLCSSSSTAVVQD
jgi:hypothetical protein